MSDSNQLSRGGAWAMGAIFMACGLPPFLIALGVLTPGASPDGAPPWVAFCAGITFMTAGICIIVDYGVSRFTLQPDGDFPDGTPMALRVANLVLGGVIVASMTAMFGWVAFGRGPRNFTTTIYLPFMPPLMQQHANELTGRVAFGGFAILMAFMFVACTVVGIKRLLRARAQ